MNIVGMGKWFSLVLVVTITTISVLPNNTVMHDMRVMNISSSTLVI